MAAVKSGVALAKATFKGFSENEATFKAAALSYYTVFALPPLLVLLLQVASMIWDPQEVRSALTGEFGSLMGREVETQVTTMIASAEGRTDQSGWRLILGIAGLIFGATGAFVSLQSALNRAWEVEPDPKQGGIRNFIMKRFLSLGMVLGIAFLMAVSLALTSALSAAGGALFGGLPETVGHVLNFVLTFAVLALLFTAMFKILPDAEVGWRDVWVGGIATAALFVLGKFLIGFYIGRSDPGSAFGAAGALAVMLVWIYYAAIIVLLGAEFTQAWVRHHGRRIEPEEGAVRVVERKQHVDSEGRRMDEHDERDRERDRAARSRHGGSGRASRERAAGDRDHDRDHRGDDRDREPASIEEVKRDIAETRARMSRDIAEIEARISGAVQSVKDRANVARMARQHPWPAVATAIAAGVAIAVTRSDARAASGAVGAVKRSPELARSAAHALADGTAGAAHAAKDAVARRDGANSSSSGDGQPEQGGFRDRLRALLVAEARQLGAELGRAADEIVGAVSGSRRHAVVPYREGARQLTTAPAPPSSAARPAVPPAAPPAGD